MNALKSHDSSLIDELNEVRVKLGSKKISAKSRKLTSKITFDLPNVVDKKFFLSLKSLVLSKTTAEWYFMYGQLCRYLKEYLNSNQQSTYVTPEGFPIGKWCGDIRWVYKAQKENPYKLKSVLYQKLRFF